MSPSSSASPESCRTVQDASPIFVHGCWRTGSTYVWAKYRSQPGYHCYLEPFHEVFADGAPAKFERQHSEGRTRDLRHPELDRHYFVEYPFRPGGGVEGFQKRFSYERFCLEESDADPALEEYVGGLIARARGLDRRPLFQCNRALLRSRWLRARFSSLDILLLRRPADTWWSFRSFPHRYFVAVIACIFGQNGDAPLLSPSREILPVPRVVRRHFGEDYIFYERFAAENEDRMYALFYYFSVVTLLHNLPIADVVLDLSLLSASAEAGADAARTLRARGIGISLEDCRLPARSDASDGASLETEKAVLSLIRARLGERLFLTREAARTALPLLDPVHREIVARFVA